MLSASGGVTIDFLELAPVMRVVAIANSQPHALWKPQSKKLNQMMSIKL